MSKSAFQFKDLPISERIQLVEDIWDSIAEDATASLPLSAEDRAELHRRLEAHRRDPESAIPWEQVRARLLQS